MATNKFNVSGKLVITSQEAMTLPKMSAAPGSPVSGDMYFDTTLNEVRIYKSGSWQTVAVGSVSLTGQTLNENEIIVGNASNQSASADTSASGDILASTSGLDIKAGVIDDSHISASAGINVSKLVALAPDAVVITDSNGFLSQSNVTPTELGYVGGVTSSIQTQLDAKASTSYVDATFIPLSQKGAALGVVPLDAGGKIDAAYLPSSVMEFKGSWDASTNSPSLADGTGNAGDVYRVSVAGSQNLGSGSQSFSVGDWVMYNGSIWQHSPATDAVTSVNGFTGAVVLDSDDIAEGSTNLYFTDERAQDAIGAMVANSSKISLTYTDATPSLVADIVAGSIVDADISASAAINATKIGSGTVDNTEFGYLNGVTSAIQTQMDGKANTALSNLSTTAINVSLLPGTNGLSLGSLGTGWAGVFSSIYRPHRATLSTTISATSGSNQVTVPSTAGVVASSSYLYSSNYLGGVVQITSVVNSTTLQVASNAISTVSGASAMISFGIVARSENETVSGTPSGHAFFRSGDAVGAASGDVFLRSGTTTSSGKTGDVTIQSGNSAGASGDVTIKTGTSASSVGNINLQSKHVVVKSTYGLKISDSSSPSVQVSLNSSVSTLAASVATFTDIPQLFFTLAEAQSMTVDYELVEATTGEVRSGTIKVVAKMDGTIGFNDTYAETGTIGNGISFNGRYDSGAAGIYLQFKDTGANTVTMKCFNTAALKVLI